MPAEADDPANQPPGIQATVGQHDDHPIGRDGRAEHPEHPQPCAPPRPRLTGRKHRPRHGNASSARDDRAGQHHEPVVQGSGIERQRDLLPVPPAHDPREERGKTGGHSEGLALRTGLAWGRDPPFVPPLLDGRYLLGAEQRENGGHRQATTRPGTRDPEPPPREYRRLWGAEVGHGA
ncbi:hypothetical protein A6A03_18525 [Chloroflexus islandicus]|uniref:Uncharacterized protein n=1 Tax=Chloroflexus islandicus TaxID=1707952 RepID=A0A178M479_9CHLR|nr:hypothetical protein [Chloroflexus islandicus]OAN43182.1 hypothetical protein A6A03_18525 [Chloroflexus islandicus]